MYEHLWLCNKCPNSSEMHTEIMGEESMMNAGCSQTIQWKNIIHLFLYIFYTEQMGKQMGKMIMN